MTSVAPTCASYCNVLGSSCLYYCLCVQSWLTMALREAPLNKQCEADNFSPSTHSHTMPHTTVTMHLQETLGQSFQVQHQQGPPPSLLYGECPTTPRTPVLTPVQCKVTISPPHPGHSASGPAGYQASQHQFTIFCLKEQSYQQRDWKDHSVGEECLLSNNT